MNTESQVPITVLIADDHPVVRTGFATSLAPFGIKMVGEAASTEEVIPRFLELKPDVLVLDIRFGDELYGLEVATELLKKEPKAKIVFVSQFNQDSIIKRTYKIGGKAFLPKNCDASDLAAAIKQAKNNELYYTPKVAATLANLSVLGDHSPETILLERELEIFKLMAQGMTIVEIAEAKNLSVKTISNVRQSIMEKLSIQRPADITRLAIRHGLIVA